MPSAVDDIVLYEYEKHAGNSQKRQGLLGLTLLCKRLMHVSPQRGQGLVAGQAQGLASCSGVGQSAPAYSLLCGCPHICKLALRIQPQLAHLLTVSLQAQRCCCPVCHLSQQN